MKETINPVLLRANEQVAALKAEISNREGEKLEMREVIDRLKAEVERLSSALAQECKCKSALYVCEHCGHQSLGYECKRCLNEAKLTRERERSARLEKVVKAARQYKAAFYENHQDALMQGNLFECIEALDLLAAKRDEGEEE